MKTTTLIATAMLAIVPMSLASTAAASDVHQIRREANHLKAKAFELKGLFRAHYRHASNYRALEHAVLEFAEIAEHTRKHAIHDAYDIEGLRDDVRLAERRFATVEHLAYLAEHSVLRRHPGKEGISRHIRKRLHETAFCLDELGDALRPVAQLHRYDHRRGGREEIDWRRAERPRPEFRRERSYRGGNSISFGDRDFGIRFRW